MLRLENREGTSADSVGGSGLAAAAPSIQQREGQPGEQTTIGNSLTIRGEITGTESLFIDGKVEGSISIPGNRVTVGKNGNVTASISAREIVVLGKLTGNVSATGRVDIRAEGVLIGDVAAARISIEDGAFFKGGIDIRMAGGEPHTLREPLHRDIAVEGSNLAASFDTRSEESISQGRYRTLEDESDINDVLPKWKSAQPALNTRRGR
jgi:cytoskeletal protein CcmA (bactofilin family)